MQLRKLFYLKIHGRIFFSINFRAYINEYFGVNFVRLDFEIDQYPEETVIRHEFHPIKRTWHTSEITIKMESKPFAHGSMRECFRL